MTYTAQQLYEAGTALSQQGLSNEQIFAEAAKYGVSPTALAEAYEVARPDLFGYTADYSTAADAALGQIGQGNFTAAQEYLAPLNTNPQYQALLQLEDYAAQFEPDPGPSIHTANNLPAEYGGTGRGGGTTTNRTATTTGSKTANDYAEGILSLMGGGGGGGSGVVPFAASKSRLPYGPRGYAEGGGVTALPSATAANYASLFGSANLTPEQRQQLVDYFGVDLRGLPDDTNQFTTGYDLAAYLSERGGDDTRNKLNAIYNEINANTDYKKTPVQTRTGYEGGYSGDAEYAGTPYTEFFNPVTQSWMRGSPYNFNSGADLPAGTPRDYTVWGRGNIHTPKGKGEVVDNDFRFKEGNDGQIYFDRVGKRYGDDSTTFTDYVPLLMMLAPFAAAIAGAGAAGATGAAEAGAGAGFLGEGMASGIPAWDAAATSAGMSLTTPAAAGAALAPEVLSKAALDGTNIFGANSVANALDISSLAGAAEGANAAGALTSIASDLGYTTPLTLSSITDLVKAVPGGLKTIGKTLGLDLGGDGGGGLGSLWPLLLLGLLAGKGGGGGGGDAGQAKIPALKATRTQTPYAPQSRPGAGGRDYFNQTKYTPLAAGGIAGLAPRHLKGAGDGVSDSIPAMIDGQQPAALARDEFVVDARTVAELGNGSSEAGAEKLYAMVERVNAARKKAKPGQDTNAAKHLPA